MAANGPINGTDLKIFSSAGGSTELIAFSQTCTLNVSLELRDITNKSSSGFQENLEGVRSFTVDVEGLYAYNDGASTPAALTNGVDDLIETNVITARQSFDFEFSAAGTNTGEKLYSGKAFLTSVALTGGTEDNATYSVTLQGTGALSIT